MWWRACAALLLCCCCAALSVRELRAADGVLSPGPGGGGLAAGAAGEAREARFVLSSRYGRSVPAPRFMSPRNDRFFMSSRYGKRSGASGGAQGERTCRCGPYRAPLALSPARYTRRPVVGSTFRTG